MTWLIIMRLAQPHASIYFFKAAATLYVCKLQLCKDNFTNVFAHESLLLFTVNNIKSQVYNIAKQHLFF